MRPAPTSTSLARSTGTATAPLRLVAVLTAGTALLTGCSFGMADEIVGEDPLPVSAAAGPADSPEQADAPAGEVLPLGRGGVTAVHVDAASRTLVAALAEPPHLVLADLSDPQDPPREVPLPGPAGSLEPTGGGVRVPVPDADLLVEVDLETATAEEIDLGVAAVSIAESADTTVLAHAGGTVGLRDEAGDHRDVPGFTGVTDVLTVEETVFALDRVESSLVQVNLPETRRGLALRAGEGATNAVADRFDRIIVTETRSGELLVFSTEPFLLRQRYPVPGGPYAVAYDEQRDLAWVTLTETNELVGYDVAGGEPVESHRFPSVRQPNSVTVDQDTGAVVVGSATGEGIQVVHP
ncbi:hypothetical protein FHR81_004662 [Actinoalloteichus hoggarensis]|uniref:Uncharacterized protein n=1 Tax=Actinoalloteichus hoggarensis TaxID=1470176 RepID=A0A221W4H1_9PSEU|nr:hypothetical protein [Actinoalloteichus hoggarensis]ASO20551.1 hypothetical protein AHOG_14545 [Actinoalloteichus hoggarensis]MBB5923591.1 hypothetical protein [Actinoalloteichus hoggarensis]